MMPNKLQSQHLPALQPSCKMKTTNIINRQKATGKKKGIQTYKQTNKWEDEILIPEIVRRSQVISDNIAVHLVTICPSLTH